MPADQWLAQLRAQWDAYNKQIMDSAGLSRKDIAGVLDVASMESQQDIMRCSAKAVEMSIAERRTWAKTLYDSASRYPVRKAWYLYASGMLDDGGEAEPWVTQLFADLEALQPRDGETK